MPTPLGPRFFSAALNFSAMMSKASSHDTGVNSPFLSYFPPVLRSMGLVRRSWPYMILERKYPFTQLRPRLTSDLMSPWVATTRLSLVATITLQPVPQKRHAALSHFSSVCARSVTRFCASAGVAMPPAAAAIAAASSFSIWRRSSGLFMRLSPQRQRRSRETRALPRTHPAAERSHSALYRAHLRSTLRSRQRAFLLDRAREPRSP